MVTARPRRKNYAFVFAIPVLAGTIGLALSSVNAKPPAKKEPYQFYDLFEWLSVAAAIYWLSPTSISAKSSFLALTT